MIYKLDCQYSESQRLRPYCHKLQREIRPRDCSTCGWYSLPQQQEKSDIQQFGELTIEDVRRIMHKGLEDEL